MSSIKSSYDCMQSADPLSAEVFSFLLDYCEEDEYVDYKLTLNDTQKSWLELTKDLMAFSNTYGGYLVFGLRDRTYKEVGLTDDDVALITDTDNLLKKVNRYVEPALSRLRAKTFTLRAKRFATIFAPASTEITHVVSKDGSFQHQSGKDKVILRKGTSYVRRSAGNHLVDSRDLDEIFSRRNEVYREQLLSKIARVVQAHPEEEVLMVAGEAEREGVRRFRITDAPDALDVRGLSLAVVPETEEEELASWISLAKRDSTAVPPSGKVWIWYSKRDELKLTQEQRLFLSEFAIRTEAPVFYWLTGIPKQDINVMLKRVTGNARSIDVISNALRVAAHLGKGIYTSMLKQIGAKAKRLSPQMKSYPKDGLAQICGGSIVEAICKAKGKKQSKTNRAEVLSELNQIVSTAAAAKGAPGAMERHEAFAYDCYLYAQKDKYSTKGKESFKEE